MIVPLFCIVFFMTVIPFLFLFYPHNNYLSLSHSFIFPSISLLYYSQSKLINLQILSVLDRVQQRIICITAIYMLFCFILCKIFPLNFLNKILIPQIVHSEKYHLPSSKELDLLQHFLLYVSLKTKLSNEEM